MGAAGACEPRVREALAPRGRRQGTLPRPADVSGRQAKPSGEGPLKCDLSIPAKILRSDSAVRRWERIEGNGRI